MSAMGPRLDRAQSHPELVSRLLLGQALKVHGLNDLPLLRADLVEGGSHFPCLPGLFEIIRKNSNICVRMQRNPPTVAFLSAVYIHCSPAGDGIQPRRRIAFDVESTGSFPRVEECQLDRLFSEAGVSKRGIRNGEYCSSIETIELPDRVRIAGGKAPDKCPGRSPLVVDGPSWISSYSIRTAAVIGS